MVGSEKGIYPPLTLSESLPPRKLTGSPPPSWPPRLWVCAETPEITGTLAGWSWPPLSLARAGGPRPRLEPCLRAPWPRPPCCHYLRSSRPCWSLPTRTRTCEGGQAGRGRCSQRGLGTWHRLLQGQQLRLATRALLFTFCPQCPLPCPLGVTVTFPPLHRTLWVSCASGQTLSAWVWPWRPALGTRPRLPAAPPARAVSSVGSALPRPPSTLHAPTVLQDTSSASGTPMGSGPAGPPQRLHTAWHPLSGPPPTASRAASEQGAESAPPGAGWCSG